MFGYFFWGGYFVLCLAISFYIDYRERNPTREEYLKRERIQERGEEKLRRRINAETAHERERVNVWWC
ncbi:MAG: hypothetical protein HYY92_01400 [Parcubacteria group bacterium]|nr:hypothetical protein [Parcubacteria group bacterium]